MVIIIVIVMTRAVMGTTAITVTVSNNNIIIITVPRMLMARLALWAILAQDHPQGHLREHLAARGGVHPDREFF